MNKRRLVIGITGGSGAILGIRLLQVLQNALQGQSIETHLVITRSARLTIEQETSYHLADVQALAGYAYSPQDIGARIASGSFTTDGMIVIPCSIKSLSAIANSYADDLLARAADVTLKEGRPLLLVVREAPLHAGHIRLLELASQAGAILFPPVPAFYAHPQGMDEIVDNIVGRVLQRMGIENDLYARWNGLTPQVSSPAAAETSTQTTNTPPTADAEPADLWSDEIWSVPAMTMATSGANGQPHAAAVYFAADPVTQKMYFFSDATSQHSQDLTGNHQAAVSLHPIVADWQNIRGLQLRGEVSPVMPGEEWDHAWTLYSEKFPFVRDMQTVIKKNQLYVFEATWCRRIDNRRGFGFKEEWTRP